MINAQGALAVPRSRVGICYVTCRFKHARCVLLSLGPFHVTRDGDEAHVPSALDIEQEQLLRVGDCEEGPVGVHTQGLVPGQSVLPLVQVDAVLLVPGKVVNFNEATGFHVCKIIRTVGLRWPSGLERQFSRSWMWKVGGSNPGLLSLS